MGEKINPGDVIYIPSESKEYTVTCIKGDSVKLTNFKSKSIVTMDYDTALEIKNMQELDLSGHNLESPI